MASVGRCSPPVKRSRSASRASSDGHADGDGRRGSNTDDGTLAGNPVSNPATPPTGRSRGRSPGAPSLSGSSPLDSKSGRQLSKSPCRGAGEDVSAPSIALKRPSGSVVELLSKEEASSEVVLDMSSAADLQERDASLADGDAVEVFLADSEDGDSDVAEVTPLTQASATISTAEPSTKGKAASRGHSEVAPGGGGDWADLLKASAVKLDRTEVVKSTGQAKEPVQFSMSMDDEEEDIIEVCVDESDDHRPQDLTRNRQVSDSSESPVRRKGQRQHNADLEMDEIESDSDGDVAASRRANDLSLLAANLSKQVGHGGCAAGLSSGGSKKVQETAPVSAPPLVPLSKFNNTAAQSKCRPEAAKSGSPQQPDSTYSNAPAGAGLLAAMGEAVIHVEMDAESGTGPRSKRSSRQPSPAPIAKLPGIAGNQNVSATPVASTQRDTTPPVKTAVVEHVPVATSTQASERVEPAQKLNLLAMMDASVQEVEKSNGQDQNVCLDGDVTSPVPRKNPREEPEVAGLEPAFELGADSKQSASGIVARPTSAHPKSSGKPFIAKDDAITGVLNKVSIKEDDSENALAFMAKKPCDLTSRVAVPPAPTTYPSASPQTGPRPAPKAPEETAEDDTEDADGLADQWDQAEAQTKNMAAEALANRGTVAPATEDPCAQPIMEKEVLAWISDIQVPAERREEDDGKVSCGCMSAPKKGSVPRLHARLIDEKDIALFLNDTDFDFNNVVHHRMLRTFFSKLTKNKSCPTIGNHWEVIGFQGGDPRTDLNRSGKVLNVIHMCLFQRQHEDLAKACWQLSRDVEQNFPMACISVNITQLVVQAFKRGSLSTLVNKRTKTLGETVVAALCKVHHAGLFKFYSLWRHQKRSIEDTDRTLKEVTEAIQKKPDKLLQDLEKGIAEDRLRQDPSKLQFTDLEFGTAGRSGATQAQAGPKGTSKQPSSLPKRYKGGAEAD